MDFSIGMDLGGTAVKVGLVDQKGKIYDSQESPTLAETNSLDAIYKNMVHTVEELMSRHEEKSIIGIGIGSPGAIDPKEGKIVMGIENIPVLNGFPLAKKLQETFKMKTYIDNDANNAARGELLFGAGKGSKDMVVVTVGTGIGGAIIMDGKIVPGVNNYAGEIGHMVIVAGGRECSCGNFGCWETYGSVTAMVRHAKAMISRGYDTTLSQYYPDSINGMVIEEEVKNGDKIAEMVFNQTCSYLGIGIANLINILNPEKVIVGGGISKAGEFLLCRIRDSARIHAMPRAWEAVEVVAAKLANKAGVLGSAALCFMNQEKKETNK